MENGSYGTPARDTPWEGSQSDGVERQLAHYAFLREERDGEVRLLFRDVPAPEVAAAFRSAGATLLSINGERARTNEQPRQPEEAETTGSRRRRKGAHGQRDLDGEVLLRYFFALRDTVYTVNIAFPTGLPGSIAAIYPGALLPERELQTRLRVVFS